MGQANVRRWVDDILPLLDRRRRPARGRRLRHPPPAAGPRPRRPTRCSRRRTTAPSRSSSGRRPEERAHVAQVAGRVGLHEEVDPDPVLRQRHGRDAAPGEQAVGAGCLPSSLLVSTSTRSGRRRTAWPSIRVRRRSAVARQPRAALVGGERDAAGTSVRSDGLQVGAAASMPAASRVSRIRRSASLVHAFDGVGRVLGLALVGLVVRGP